MSLQTWQAGSLAANGSSGMGLARGSGVMSRQRPRSSPPCLLHHESVTISLRLTAFLINITHWQSLPHFPRAGGAYMSHLPCTLDLELFT